MATFLYRCAFTGQKAQGWVVDDVTATEGDTYQTFQTFTCLACQQVHLVDAATGKVLGIQTR